MIATVSERKQHTAAANDDVDRPLGCHTDEDNAFNDLIDRRIITQSPLMKEVFQLARKAAQVDSTVLVTGESGTGKELIAEAIHVNSPRAAGPFVTVNMAAVPEALVESELFGHVKGAFTDATGDRIGCFEAASGGTIFIDEIGDLLPASQAKLLRVLEKRVVTPVGSNHARTINVRVVAATNRPLEKMISKGAFREDLYYRLNVVRVLLPPLRERIGDVSLLVHHFVEHYCTTYHRPPMRVDDELMEFLQAHRWPGNVRELRNCVESMVVLSNSNRLTLNDVPRTPRKGAPSAHARFQVPEDVTLAEMEKAMITQTLERCGGNRTRAANKLSISVRTLQRKLARWAVDGACARVRGAETESARA